MIDNSNVRPTSGPTTRSYFSQLALLLGWYGLTGLAVLIVIYQGYDVREPLSQTSWLPLAIASVIVALGLEVTRRTFGINRARNWLAIPVAVMLGSVAYHVALTIVEVAPPDIVHLQIPGGILLDGVYVLATICGGVAAAVLFERSVGTVRKETRGDLLRGDGDGGAIQQSKLRVQFLATAGPLRVEVARARGGADKRGTGLERKSEADGPDSIFLLLAGLAGFAFIYYSYRQLILAFLAGLAGVGLGVAVYSIWYLVLHRRLLGRGWLVSLLVVSSLFVWVLVLTYVAANPGLRVGPALQVAPLLAGGDLSGILRAQGLNGLTAALYETAGVVALVVVLGVGLTALLFVVAAANVLVTVRGPRLWQALERLSRALVPGGNLVRWVVLGSAGAALSAGLISGVLYAAVSQLLQR